MYFKIILFFASMVIIGVKGLPLKNTSPQENQDFHESATSPGFFQAIGNTMKHCVNKVTGGIFDRESDSQNKNVNLSKPVVESDGIFQYLGNTVKGYVADKAKNIFESISNECASYRTESGELKATVEGEKFCKNRCKEIYDKINRAKETIKTIKRYLPFCNNLELNSKNNRHLDKFKCIPNLPKTKLLCDCPRAPDFNLGKSLKKYLEIAFSESSQATKGHKHKYWKHGYGSRYGYGPGFYLFEELLDRIFSLILLPARFLFALVMFPVTLFLLFFFGMG